MSCCALTLDDQGNNYAPYGSTGGAVHGRANAALLIIGGDKTRAFLLRDLEERIVLSQRREYLFLEEHAGPTMLFGNLANQLLRANRPPRVIPTSDGLRIGPKSKHQLTRKYQ